MSDCCKASQPIRTQVQTGLCQWCGKKGQPVDRLTVEGLVEGEIRATLNGQVYAFCETPSCPVVYYSAEGAEVVKTQLRVRVGIKETQDPIPVCYCFGITKRMIDEEIGRTGRSTASTHIRSEVKAGNCRCEIENPSGRCCLGDVMQVEKRAAAELLSVTGPATPKAP